MAQWEQLISFVRPLLCVDNRILAGVLFLAMGAAILYEVARAYLSGDATEWTIALFAILPPLLFAAIWAGQRWWHEHAVPS